MFDRLSKAVSSLHVSSWLTIRSRLVILALVAIAPIVGERIRGLEVGRADRLRITGTQMVDMARHGADVQAQILSSARSLMNAAADSQTLATLPSEQCTRLVTAIDRDSGFLDGLSIVSPEGRVLCSSLAEVVGQRIGDRPHFKAALATGSFTVSNFFITRLTKRPVIAVALPKIAADGLTEFVVNANLNLTWVEGLIATLMERPNTNAFIVDGAGTILARYPKIETLVGTTLADNPLVRQTLSGPAGSFSANGFDGVRRIFAVSKLSGTDAYFGVGIEEAEVLRNINRQVTIAYWVIAGAILLVVLGAWFGGNRFILRPMRALVEKAVRYGQGNFSSINSSASIPPEFAPLDRALNRMAEQLASREQNLQEENRQLDNLAQFDGLTGVANRRSFDAKLRAAWIAAASRREAVSLLMIDVDYFKLFNDRYGHVEGDVCLKRMAACLAQEALRPTDYVARYGGEEFAVVLPGVSSDAALAIAERLRKAAFDLNIPNGQAPEGRVTISIGVASLTADGKAEVQTLIEAADSALYLAKRKGRNTVSTRTSKLIAVAG
jgi:diguanylate cyclase (GGDEF)-like protein